MPDSARAVEVLARGDVPTLNGYGSGYSIGGGLILTCAHVVAAESKRQRFSIRDTAGHSMSVSIAWLDRSADLALFRVSAAATLPGSPVSFAVLPHVTTGAAVKFLMWGWPRGGEMTLRGERPLREAVQVDGEIKLAEVGAAKSGLVRLRPEEHYPALADDSYWKGVSGAAVHCGDYIVGIQRLQPDAQHSNYLAAQPVSAEAFSCVYEGISGQALLDEAGIAIANPDLDAFTPRDSLAVVSRQVAPESAANDQRTKAVRPYLLLETGSIIGRSRLRGQVLDFATDATERSSRLLLLVGLAGIGKSALAWDA